MLDAEFFRGAALVVFTVVLTSVSKVPAKLGSYFTARRLKAESEEAALRLIPQMHAAMFPHDEHGLPLLSLPQRLENVERVASEARDVARETRTEIRRIEDAQEAMKQEQSRRSEEWRRRLEGVERHLA